MWQFTSSQKSRTAFINISMSGNFDQDDLAEATYKAKVVSRRTDADISYNIIPESIIFRGLWFVSMIKDCREYSFSKRLRTYFSLCHDFYRFCL